MLHVFLWSPAYLLRDLAGTRGSEPFFKMCVDKVKKTNKCPVCIRKFDTQSDADKCVANVSYKDARMVMCRQSQSGRDLSCVHMYMYLYYTYVCTCVLACAIAIILRFLLNTSYASVKCVHASQLSCLHCTLMFSSVC